MTSPPPTPDEAPAAPQPIDTPSDAPAASSPIETPDDAPPAPPPTETPDARAATPSADERPAAPRTRLSPEDRRRQLVGIGLQLLTEQPLDTITVDEVARRAGISRGLLFHYFPSKRAFHAAIAAAGVRRLLRAVAPDASLPAAERLRDALDRYVAFVERRHGRVMEMARGPATADPDLAALMADAHATIADRLLAVLDAPPSAAFPRQAARAWLSFAESLTLDWIAEPTTDRERLIDYLVATFSDALRRADGPEASG